MPRKIEPNDTNYLQIVNPNNPFLRAPSVMQTSASKQTLQNSYNSNGNNKDMTMITPTSNDFKNTNLMESMVNLTPNFFGLDNMVSGLMGMMKGQKLTDKGKDMTMITPMFRDTNSGPSVPGEVSLDPFFDPSPKIPINYMPGSVINEISQSLKSVTDGWSVNNGGTPAMPTPQSDLGYPNSISSTFGDNTLTNPAGN